MRGYRKRGQRLPKKYPMNISSLMISGFRSFGSAETLIPLRKDLSAFIGLNSAGKTAALEALRKLFGQSLNERELVRQDFHVGEAADDEEAEKSLTIEVRLDFDEDEKDAIPHFFAHMVIDEEGASPYLRIRLESNWTKSELSQEGSVDSSLYFIKVAAGEPEDDLSKIQFPNHLKSLIQIIYVPAIRRPGEQIRYASGSILYRVLRKINWDDEFKAEFETHITEITDLFAALPEVQSIQSAIGNFWSRFHKDKRYSQAELTFGGSDFESILKKLEIAFSPTEINRSYGVDDLGDGYRSLFYLTLVCALLEVESTLKPSTDEIGISRPLLTVLAIEEPENHIALQLLGRVINILTSVSKKSNCQVVLSSHTPAIVKRVPPEAICHFRITPAFSTEVNVIALPDKKDEAYKYIRGAVVNFPEIYFAKLVVIGEGDSEEIVFGRLISVTKVDFDDNIITFAPLGHRFVNHIWRLLEALHIPYITLLDLDTEREGGGWGRVKYALQQLIAIGRPKKELLKLKDGGILSNKELEEMHTWEFEKADLVGWLNVLKKHNVYYSSPLDLDFLMLEHYPAFYKNSIPKGSGPRIPDEDFETEAYETKLEKAIQATLKSEDAVGEHFTQEQKALMIWYNYLFLGRGKPVTHIQVLANMKKQEIIDNLPPIFTTIFDKISQLLMPEES